MNLDLFSASGEKVELLYICNTCTFTYYFDDGPYQVDPTMIQFRENSELIPVYFESQNLAMYLSDGSLLTFTLTVGLVPTLYKSPKYFNEPEKGALGLLP